MRLPPLARRATVLAATIAALVPGAPAEAALTHPERALKRAVNHARTSHGLRSLKVGPRLHRRTHSFAEYLRRTDSFYHSSSGAYGRVTSRMARNVVNRWMNSPSHRANILRRGMRVAGFGVARSEFLGYGRMRVSVARFKG